jgi:hypothetical protein
MRSVVRAKASQARKAGFEQSRIHGLEFDEA